jgi:uncharacterized protein
VCKAQGHQILAVNRGEREGKLKVAVTADREKALGMIFRRVLIPESPAAEYVRRAAEDAYTRLMFPSVEREIRSMLTENATEGAIKMFALNLRLC